MTPIARKSQKQSAATNTASLTPLLDDLVAANHILAAHGVVDSSGHVSCRRSSNSDRFFLSRAIAPKLVTRGDILEFDLDCRPIDAGNHRIYAEIFIHGEIYKVRPDVQAIVHTHSQAVIPFGVVDVPLQPIFHMSAFVSSGVPIFETRKKGGMTDMSIRNAALGKALAEVLKDHPAALMRGHGAVAVGKSLSHAVARSIYLQENASMQRDAIAIAGKKKITYLHPKEANKIEERHDKDMYSRAWELWKSDLF